MLKLTSLILEDFGPYKNQQVIDLPEDGVTIVYGENMRGKTTLINAIKYAFFGKVLTRGSQSLSFDSIENWENANEGKHGFKVILRFMYEGVPYELTRQCKLRKGITKPQSDLDYEELTFLLRDGETLGPENARLELSRIMPESVSRFFLFDGELLQQYEELLRDESEMGKKIKESIERILGVPILTQARTNLNRVLEDAQKAESKAAQKNQQTQELGNNQAYLIEQRAGHKKEIERLTGLLNDARNKKALIEQDIRKTERLMALFLERERIGNDIQDIDRRLADKEGRRREVMTTAWKGIIGHKVRVAITNLQNQIDTLRSEDTSRAFASYMLTEIHRGLHTDTCPICERQLDGDSNQVLNNLVMTLTDQISGTDNSDTVSYLNSQIVMLRGIEGQDVSAIVEELSNSVDELIMDRYSKNDRLKQINEDTKSIDESAQRKLQSDYDRTVQEIVILTDGITKQEELLSTVEDNIRNVQNRLDILGGADLKKDRHRREIAKKLFDLMDDTVEVYRDALRTRVEADATNLFLQLTTEPEYHRLQINDNYGLNIVHQDGGIIPVRSAGAEHIVALSLMGALQYNAPLQGPIIMDSPFGRLDTGHTTKVVESLPVMADQVMLLVYKSEIEPHIARTYLKGALKKEYEIVRQTARYSTIEVVNE